MPSTTSKGLGTGLGSTLIVEGAIAALELGHLQYSDARTYEDDVGDAGRKRLGGGNVRRLKRLPSRTRRGRNADAIRGGYRLWQPQAARLLPIPRRQAAPITNRRMHP